MREIWFKFPFPAEVLKSFEEIAKQRQAVLSYFTGLSKQLENSLSFAALKKTLELRDFPMVEMVKHCQETWGKILPAFKKDLFPMNVPFVKMVTAFQAKLPPTFTLPKNFIFTSIPEIPILRMNEIPLGFSERRTLAIFKDTFVNEIFRLKEENKQLREENEALSKELQEERTKRKPVGLLPRED